MARLLGIGHGAQILLTDVTYELVLGSIPAPCQVRNRGKHRLKDLSRPQSVYQIVSTEWPVNLKRLKSLPSPLAGGVAAIATTIATVVSYRSRTLSASEEVDAGLLSPLSLYTGIKGIVLELSLLNEYMLLGVGTLLLALMLAIGFARRHAINREAQLQEPEGGRVFDWIVNQRTFAFLALLALLTLGAYGYQQYLWRITLPIPEDATGFAITREATAASFQDQFNRYALYPGTSGRHCDTRVACPVRCG